MGKEQHLGPGRGDGDHLPLLGMGRSLDALRGGCLGEAAA